MDKLIEKWEPTTLLEELNDDDKLKLSNYLEEGLQFLKDETFDYRIFLPLIRRFYSEVTKEFDVEKLYYEVCDFWKERDNINKELNKGFDYDRYDVDVNMVHMFIEIMKLEEENKNEDPFRGNDGQN